MRKFPKAFTRRKSTANAFEEMDNGTPPEHTFKVFDRGGETVNKSFDGGAKLAKPPTSGPGRPKPSHGGEDNMFENLGNYRASGGSNSNTASTTDNSSRLSAASTAPSSTDLPGREDYRSPHDKHYNNIPIPPAPKATSSFSLKNAGRSLSWGRTKPPTPTTPKDSSLKELPSLPPQDEDPTTSRSRAVTASSYASTATPPKLDDKDLGLSLGGDFSDMFAGFGKRKSAILEVEQNRAMSHSPDILPSGPASRANRFNSPTHLTIDKSKEIDESPLSWSSQNSHDGLMSNRSPPPPVAPRKDLPPPVPQHGQNRTNVDNRVVNRTERPGAASADGLKRSSALVGRRQSTLEYTDSVDEDARLLRESVNASRKMNDPGYSSKVRDSWALPSSTSYKIDDVAVSSWRAGSVETTPRPNKQERKPTGHEDSMFDSHIAAAADLAERFQERSSTPPTRPNLPNKVMTPAQFERYRQDQERLRSIGGRSREDDDDDDDETYDDDEDDAEKAKQLAKQRRKQEAHMAVYRQQMMKVTGETTAASPRPGMLASHSSPSLLAGKVDEGEEEDEEIPLAILQAHGFPNKNKPPMRSTGSNPNLRASTMSGAGADGRLPVFARHLPQDPYLGAGLQSPMHRESMAFAGGAGSVAGAPPRGLPPGGLVGVIANEERSRAMRRGSPNAQGDYGGPNRASTTGSMYGGMGQGPMGPMGPMGMNPMMMGQGDQSQMQLTQQMQQFMQMQMQFMQMMTSGQGPPSQVGPMQGELPRPSSSHHLRPASGGPNHQRAMTMMEPNAAPWMQPGGFAPSIHIQGYTPSIAPSERSNIGMPGRYRPVSQAPFSDNKSRMSTMSGALPNWDNKNLTPTVRAVKKSGNASDEDDEEGWEEMKKKREKKKSMWKSKRDTNGFKDMLNFN